MEHFRGIPAVMLVRLVEENDRDHLRPEDCQETRTNETAKQEESRKS